MPRTRSSRLRYALTRCAVVVPTLKCLLHSLIFRFIGVERFSLSILPSFSHHCRSLSIIIVCSLVLFLSSLLYSVATASLPLGAADGVVLELPAVSHLTAPVHRVTGVRHRRHPSSSLDPSLVCVRPPSILTFLAYRHRPFTDTCMFFSLVEAIGIARLAVEYGLLNGVASHAVRTHCSPLLIGSATAPLRRSSDITPVTHPRYARLLPE